MSNQSEHRRATEDLGILRTPESMAPGKLPSTARVGGGRTTNIVLRVESAEAARELSGLLRPEEAIERASGSSGSALPGDLRSRFESSLGTDLSDVRVHTSAASADAARSVGARAFAYGQDVHFGAGQYDPTSSSGQFLIAHEVAHTVQQRGAAPARQDKLEVSHAGDAAEVEADRAASAMVRGAATTVSVTPAALSRFPDDDGMGGGSPLGPLGNGGPGGPALTGGGFPEIIPASDFRGTVQPIPVNLDQSPPESQMGETGPIPGWQVQVPAGTTPFGPGFQMPAQTITVQGDDHSPDAKSAWAEWGGYRNTLKQTWDDSRLQLDAFIQQKKGAASLEAELADVSDPRWHLQMGQQPGNASDKGLGAQVDGSGTTVGDVDNRVDNHGDDADFKQGLKATGQDASQGLAGNTVQAAVAAVNSVRQKLSGQADKAAGSASTAAGSQQLVYSEALKLKAKELSEEQKKDEEAVAKMKSGQAALDAISPKIMEAVNWVKDLNQKIEVVKTAFEASKNLVEGGAKAYEGDVGDGARSMVEGIEGMVQVYYWDQVESKNEEIAGLAQAQAAILEESQLAAFNGFVQTHIGNVRSAKGEMTALQGLIGEERNAFQHLADTLEGANNQPNGWKGKNAADGKLAAQAMRSLPAARKLLTFVTDVRGRLPQLPELGNHGQQGYTLAINGVGAPGPAGSLDTAGRILGAHAPIDGEVARWGQIVQRFEAIAAQLGVVPM